MMIGELNVINAFPTTRCILQPSGLYFYQVYLFILKHRQIAIFPLVQQMKLVSRTTMPVHSNVVSGKVILCPFKSRNYKIPV